MENKNNKLYTAIFTLLLIICMIICLMTSCSAKRNLKRDEKSLQTISSEGNESREKSDSLSLLLSELEEQTRKLNVAILMSNIMKEHLAIIEATNIQEKEYYESGALKSERTVDNNKQTALDRETVKNLEGQINILEAKFNSVNVVLNGLRKEYSEFQNKFDSLKETSLKEENKLSGWQNFQVWLGRIALGTALIALVIFIIRLKK